MNKKIRKVGIVLLNKEDLNKHKIDFDKVIEKINFDHTLLFVSKKDNSLKHLKKTIKDNKLDLILRIESLALFEPNLINKMVNFFFNNSNQYLYLILKDIGYVDIIGSRLINDLMLSKKNVSSTPLDLLYSLNKLKIKIKRFSITKSDIIKIISKQVIKFYKYPKRIAINITNDCNLECIMCNRYKYYKNKSNKIGYMGFNLFKKIIDEVTKWKHKPGISLQSWGECLLHPQFLKMAKYVKKKKLPLAFNTNCVLLTEDLIKKLIDIKLDALLISLDAFKKSTYDNIRFKSNFKRVIQNINYLLKNKGKKKIPKVIITMVKINQDKKEIASFIKYWTNHADFVYIQNCEDESLEIKKKNGTILKNMNRFPCLQAWLNLGIWWNGQVNCCITDYKQRSNMGNLNEKTIEEIWNNKKFIGFRRDHINLDFKNLICEKCDHWRTYLYKIDIKNKIIVSESEIDQIFKRINNY
jgi:spiro-SPASM protein